MSLVDYQSSSDEENNDTVCETIDVKDTPQPTRVKQPVKITVPSASKFEECIENDGPSALKKARPQMSAGLLSMLPPPKYCGSGGKVTCLVPNVVKKKGTGTKKSESSDDKVVFPSAISKPNSFPNNKPATSMKTSTGDVINNGNEESSSSNDYFSLDNTIIPSTIDISSIPLPNYSSSMPSNSYNINDAESNFIPNVNEASEVPTGADSSVAEENLLNDERFLRLQGKKMHGLEDVNIIDISGDSLLSNKTEWHIKSITEEKKVIHSRKRGDMPTHLQKRKHQITYLAYQAKERELDLKNQWSQNRLTKQQTQAKYGF